MPWANRGRRDEDDHRYASRAVSLNRPVGESSRIGYQGNAFAFLPEVPESKGAASQRPLAGTIC
jgi:hypothetical protein